MNALATAKRRVFDISVVTGETVETFHVEGYPTVHPDFAITQQVFSSKFYVVTHLPTGMRVTASYMSLPKLRKFAAAIAAINIDWRAGLRHNQTIPDLLAHLTATIGKELAEWLHDINYPTQEERVSPCQNLIS